MESVPDWTSAAGPRNRLLIWWFLDHSTVIAVTEEQWCCWVLVVAKQDGGGAIVLNEVARGGIGLSHDRIAKHIFSSRLLQLQ